MWKMWKTLASLRSAYMYSPLGMYAPMPAPYVCKLIRAALFAFSILCLGN